MSQILLGCGVNDLGGTLMNESISTAAGTYLYLYKVQISFFALIFIILLFLLIFYFLNLLREGAGHGQFTNPKKLRSIIHAANRVAVQRNTDYSLKSLFSNHEENLTENEKIPLDNEKDFSEIFGSFEKLTKSDTNRYKDYHIQRNRNSSRKLEESLPATRSYSTSSSSPSLSSSFSSTLYPSTSLSSSSSASSSSSSSTLRFSSSHSSSPLTSRSSSSIDSRTNSISTRRSLFHTSTSKSSSFSSTSTSHSPPFPLPSVFNPPVSSFISSPLPSATKITYSSSFTIVPTYECFNLCSYCNFRTDVRTDDSLMIQTSAVHATLQRLQKLNSQHPENAVHEILILSGRI